MTEQPYDLRKVIEELKTLPGQYHETDLEIDPEADLSGVYRYIGTGGTVKRPTQRRTCNDLQQHQRLSWKTSKHRNNG